MNRWARMMAGKFFKMGERDCPYPFLLRFFLFLHGYDLHLRDVYTLPEKDLSADRNEVHVLFLYLPITHSGFVDSFSIRSFLLLSVNGHRYFKCKEKFGGFVRPDKIQVGDYPPEEIELDDLDEEM